MFPGIGMDGNLLFFSQNFKKPVIEYTTDQSVTIIVELVYSQNSVPEYYTTRLKSPICMDDLCNPIDIEIEWDLLGNFRNYNEVPGDPITKFDHQLFTEEDHQQLKSILSDKASLLQDYKIEDLVDTTDLIYSEEIDGMTGATSKTFAEEVVGGAIYTCYVLWYVVNEELDDQILKYTQSIMDDELLSAMIESRKIDYLNYILERKDAQYSMKIRNSIGELVWEDDPIIGSKAVSVAGEGYWLSDVVSDHFSELFVGAQNAIQNAILSQFLRMKVTKEYLDSYIHLLPKVDGRKRKAIYKIFESNLELFDDSLKERLKEEIKAENYPTTIEEYKLLSQLDIK